MTIWGICIGDALVYIIAILHV